MRTSRSTTAIRRRLIAVGVAITLTTVGVPALAYAAPSTSLSTQPAAEALCADAKPGTFRCFALRRTDVVGTKGLLPNVTPAGYGPTDLASAYNIPPNGGAGQTVAIVDAFDNPNAEADLAVYRAQFGLPECSTANGCFRKVDQRGGTTYPTPDAGWAGEIALDIQMVSAVAPLAHILLVEGDDNSFDSLSAAENTAVALGAKYVSNSYGTAYSSTPGSGEDPSEVTDLDPFYNHPGVVITASSGDDDYGVSYPAASQYVTSVGGTALTRDTSSRGWTESVWHNSFGGPGSGCSVYEPKPAWQSDTGCAKRAVADVAAVADPVTGVAVYNTYQDSGWAVYGGTSASAPIIAGIYAGAGTPVPGTYPASYPYASTGGLFDVTAGNNGTCSPAYLCTAGPGFDGPTGLGTPNGLSAFTTGPHGIIAGTVTDASTAAPLVGATVSAGDASAQTDSAGQYALTLAVGVYDLSVSAFGYQPGSRTGITVAADAVVSENVALTPIPTQTVTGTVTDGSGHAWPLYASITVNGLPNGPIFTDPVTGQYSVTLPEGAYHLTVAANYPGYETVTKDITVASAPLTVDASVPVNTTGCFAPGYQLTGGLHETFDVPTTPPGWTVTNATENGGWQFNDPGARGNLTGGTGGFAIMDSDKFGSGKHEDSVLTTPLIDLSGETAPVLSFNNDYRGYSNSTADVDVSIDGGATWSNVWHHTTDSVRGTHESVPLPSAAGQSAVQLRFHYTGTWAWWWELDNVQLGTPACVAKPGGLVTGIVTDGNTKAGLVGATVKSLSAPTDAAITGATPTDPNLGDGFYWLFSSLVGTRTFEVSKLRYVTTTKAVTVRANKVVAANYTLAAGNIKINAESISKTVGWGATASQTLTVRNTGKAPATVTLSERPGGTVPLAQTGAPLNLVSGNYSSLSLRGSKSTGVAPKNVTPAAAPWTGIANYPTIIQDNAAALSDGKLYSAFGYNGTDDVSSLYVFDPEAGAWSALASAADTRESPAMAAIAGKIYVSGGWGASGAPDGKTEIYDPAGNAWSVGAVNPKPYAGSGSAALGGKLYVVGGCTASACGSADVMVYDPAANTWSPTTSYPEPVSWEACGAIAGKLYCAGGLTDAATVRNGYVYDPSSAQWTPIAALPIDLWASGHAAAEGKLLISGGVTAGHSQITNQGYAYDPGTGGWTALPNSNNTLYRGASACGFYKVGGSPGGQFTPPVASSEVLPGYVNCGESSDVSWLSADPVSLTLAAGASATVTVTLNAGVDDITQPGTFSASLLVATDTPYASPALPVTFTVKPPATWGKIAGTVTGPSGPVAGATVQIYGYTSSFTLRTDANGYYQLWLDAPANNPLTVICAKDGYQPQVKTVRITRAQTTTVDWALLRAP